MKRKYLYLIVAVVVVGTGGYLYFTNSSSKEIRYRTEKVSRGDIVLQVRATGTINPLQTVQVGSQVSGIIQKIFVDFNSQVKKGDVIAQIDSTFLYASVKEVQASLERARAQMNNNQRTFSRTSDLFNKNLVSQADLDAAKAAYEASSADFKQAEASLDRARVNLRYALIRAPIDGVVISRDVDVGQTVAASFQTPKMFSIANDLKRMQVEASVDEADIGQVKSGQEVTFTVDAYPEEKFRGSVTQIRLAPVTVQNVVTYTVVIEVPNPDLKLRPGMTATVSILVDKRDGALRVPTLALRFQPPPEVLDKLSQDTSDGEKEQKVAERKMGSQGGQRRPSEGWKRKREKDESQNRGQSPVKKTQLWILEGGKNLKPITVSTGINDNRYVEIIGDELKEGDEVIIGSNGSEVASGPMQQSNPFQTRMPGGGVGRGRGF